MAPEPKSKTREKEGKGGIPKKETLSRERASHPPGPPPWFLSCEKDETRSCWGNPDVNIGPVHYLL
jgi:hypothetical protein